MILSAGSLPLVSESSLCTSRLEISLWPRTTAMEILYLELDRIRIKWVLIRWVRVKLILKKNYRCHLLRHQTLPITPWDKFCHHLHSIDRAWRGLCDLPKVTTLISRLWIVAHLIIPKPDSASLVTQDSSQMHLSSEPVCPNTTFLIHKTPSCTFVYHT